MKPLSSAILAGSLLLNAALVVVLAVGAAQKDSDAAPVVAKTAKPSNAKAAPAYNAETWPTLNQSDLPGLVTRLREGGFPPAFVRAIISAQLQEQYNARRKALDPDADNRPFWKAPTQDLNTQMALRQLSREQQKQMRELLGADAEPTDPFNRANIERQFGHLSADKRAEAQRIVREFNDLRNDVYAARGPGPITFTQADQDKMTALDRQMTGELRKIMTPQEFADYELRGSNTANSLRYNLAAFDATESEFRALFQLQRTFDDQFPPMFGNPSQEQMRLRSEAQRQLNEQIKSTLGPVRTADYERATNYEYRNTNQLVARLELPPETTNLAWDVRQDIQKRANSIRTDRAIPQEQRNAQLATLQKEALERVTPIFGGTRGAEAYKQYGGQWIDQLVPRPANRSGATSAPGIITISR